MPPSFTDEQKAIIDGGNFAHLATLFPDGSPQVTPVWIDRDGDLLRINSAEGRAKVRNLRRDPRVAVEINLASNPYQYVAVRGRAIAFEHEGADAQIDALAGKYLGEAAYPWRAPGEQRVTIVIKPEKISGNSGGSSAKR
jgi:PPOX class probable F420-dependent enzyme